MYHERDKDGFSIPIPIEVTNLSTGEVKSYKSIKAFMTTLKIRCIQEVAQKLSKVKPIIYTNRKTKIKYQIKKL